MLPLWKVVVSDLTNWDTLKIVLRFYYNLVKKKPNQDSLKISRGRKKLKWDNIMLS